MAETALKSAIKRIRTYRRLLEMYPEHDSNSYERVIKNEWNNIRQIFRSDDMHMVYEVEGLHGETVNYWSWSDLTFAMSDIAEGLIGLEITIKVKQMRGTDIGRMLLLDE